MTTASSRILVYSAALLIAVGACAPAAHRVVERVYPLDATLVQVRNEGFADVVIYALRSGMPLRLGMVHGHSEETFELPVGLVDAALLELVARPIAGNAFRISPLNVTRGQQVELVLASHLRFSHAAVWDRE